MKNLLMLIILILPGFANSAKLQLLYDTGNSNLIKYQKDPKIKLERPDPIKFLASQFPVVSKKWKLGEFESKRIHFKEMKSPIFVIGCDDTSLRWVEHRRKLIENKRVLGFVINCNSFDDYNSLKAAIYPIVVQPINFDSLADYLKHDQYPAYIHQTAIEQ